MPINVNITAESIEELKRQVKKLATDLGLFNAVNTLMAEPSPELVKQICNCNCDCNKTSDVNQDDLTDDTEGDDSAFEPKDDENNLNTNDDDDDEEDTDLSKTESINPEIADHFDEIFGTVGNRPMPGNRVRINGTLFQGEGHVVATNYGLLYNASSTYDTKVMKVKADNGKSYSYNISDLRAKKVAKI